MTPEGALTEEQRLELAAKSEDSNFAWTGGRGYYAVMNPNAELLIGGSYRPVNNKHQFTFGWKPKEAYYFTNYFHALAYSLQLKATKCDIQHSV